MAWKAALNRAGIADFRWHDPRHTWASWHVQAGTPSHALQELGGWESAEMVRRYVHLAFDHLAEYADRIARPRAIGGTNLAHVDFDQQIRLVGVPIVSIANSDPFF
jgi:integrase